MAYKGYSKIRVLIVDDFDSFRMTVNKILLDLGVRDIDIACNGKEALSKCAEHQYDLVLCDYNLGDGKNGQQVLEELRQKKRLCHNSLFILVSADSSKSIVMAAYDSEPDAYLTKPITAKTLQKRLERLLQQRDEMAEAFRALDNGQMDMAMGICRQKISVGSRYTARCQRLLGQLYLQAGRFDMAEQVFCKVLEVRSLDWAQLGLAQVKSAQGEVDTATQWLLDIVASNPLCMQAYDALAETYHQKGDSEQEQSVLEKAVEISPMALLRQQRLGETAADNNDVGVAAKAFRRAVKLGEHSCNDDIANHLNFGRMTARLFKEDDVQARDLSRDALRVIDALGPRIPANTPERASSRCIESQLYAEQGDKLKAEELVAEAETVIESIHAEMGIDSELDFVRALMSADQDKRAKEMLKELIEQYKDDQQALKKIDSLLEEPISEENRKRVAEFNKEAIGYYNQKRFQDAIERFKQAKKLFPNHIGIHLNLVQALVSEMREYGGDDDLMELCLATIRKVDKKVKPNHDQFNRFRQLQEMVRTLEREQT